MRLCSLKLENFRSASLAELNFSDGVNLLYGRNAEGKTNVLEAIYFFARGKSFRGARDADLVRFGAPGCSIEIEFIRRGEKETLAYRYFEGSRARFLNGVRISAKESIGRFNAVLFCPDHLSIVKGAPSQRREFMDVALSQLYGEYLSQLSVQKRMIEQKNALFKKEEGFDPKLLFAYNEKLASCFAKICLFRRGYVNEISKYVGETISQISGGTETAKIEYKCGIPAEFAGFEAVKSEYIRLLGENMKREVAAKMCLVGTQRDDLLFTVSDRDARQFASQGQQRSIAIALKLAEGDMVRRERGESPVFLLDDVLGELDEARRAYILSKMGERQLIVTACERGEYAKRHSVSMIEVCGGRYRQI